MPSLPPFKAAPRFFFFFFFFVFGSSSQIDNHQGSNAKKPDIMFATGVIPVKTVADGEETHEPKTGNTIAQEGYICHVI